MYHERDSFWTRSYKSGFVHGCYDRFLKKEVIEVQCDGEVAREVASIHAAKIRITMSEKGRLA